MAAFSTSINWAQELCLNRYYDPFNPELHLYVFNSQADTSIPVRTTALSSLPVVGDIWNGWIYFIRDMQLRFWEAWDKDADVRYDNVWTPT